jgi:hypothetical protein
MKTRLYSYNSSTHQKKHIMNCNTAKKINLIEFLIKLGFNPKKTTNTDTWFLSPFRDETTPSFKISNHKNHWIDFGEGVGGNIIDFVIKFYQCDIKKALEILSDKSFSFHKPKNNIHAKKTYSILKTKEVSNKNLIDYLKSRKLNLNIINKYCSEVYYKFETSKEYYAIGFKNDSGGFEMRNKYFKGCLGKKDITTINNNADVVSLFESWSDFISYLTLKKEEFEEDFIILNSTSMVKKVITQLESYTKLKIFFDNDTSGDNALDFISKNSNINLEDCRKYYKEFKDLNEYLINKKGKGK